MGPLLMTGLMAMGSAIAIGWIASRTTRSSTTGRSPVLRSFFVICTAFAAGIGVLGVVVGLLAVMLGLNPDTDATGYAAAAGPAIIGAIVGLAFIGRDWSLVDASARVIGIWFVASQALLATVVAVLAGAIRETGTARPPGGAVFSGLGIVAMIGVLAIGVIGGRALRDLGAADERSLDAARTRALGRIVPFQAVSVGATIVAMVLLVTAGP